MLWTRIRPYGARSCASANCGRPALWHGEDGDVGSDYCPLCRDTIDADNLRRAAIAVVAFDWSDNDADAVAAIADLRKAVEQSAH